MRTFMCGCLEMWEDYSIFAQQREISIGRVMINGHDYVDLGLSVLWATCNVGAEKAEEYGDYYAWGRRRWLNGTTIRRRTASRMAWGLGTLAETAVMMWRG